MTGDRGHVTRDRWHVTCDTCHMTHSIWWTFSQNFSSLVLPVWDWECLEHILTKGSLTELINYGGDCRTAPATPGLFMICISIFYCFSILVMQCNTDDRINQTKFSFITFMVQYEQCDHKIIIIIFLSLETKKWLLFILWIVLLLVFMWRKRGLLLICCVCCYFPLCVSYQNFLTVFNFGK